MPNAESLLDEWFPRSDPSLQSLRTQVQSVHLPAGQTVFHRGDTCRNYLVVVSGSVRVQVLSTGGREVVLYRVGEGQSCVITTSCLISHEAYPAEGITESPTDALVIPQELFNEALGRSENFRTFVFASQGQRLGDLIKRVEDVAFGRIDARLAKHLVDRCENRPGLITATHQQLASELGTAREVVSRQLKVFEKQAWIAVHRGSVEILEPQALSRVWMDAE
ncbi:MAG TPA: Crp/Fnr family transcriptional regulator [Gammaproteobacteria bacterium]|nr:Crp/Fnr family transcriptional regulator [Gammaproteobacteria bacterium]